MKASRILSLLAAYSLTASSAFAWEPTANVGVGVQYTDNALKASDNKESDYETSLDGGLGLTHEGEDWNVAIDYRAQYLEYSRDTQSDSTQVNGNADIQYEQFEDILFWNLSNSIRSVVEDKRFEDISDNRENRSISTISPELRIAMSRVDSLNTTVSYSRIAYEDNNQQDSERLGGSLLWNHRFSSVDAFDIGVGYYDVTFDDALSDYEYYTGRVAYASALAKLSYRLTLGYNETQRDLFDDTDGPYVRANFIFDNGFSQWELNVLRELTDTSRGNNNGSITDLGDTGSSNGRVDVYEVVSGELAYNTEALCDLCTVRLSLLASEESYEILPDDNIELGARIEFDYSFTRRTTLGFDVSFFDYSFTNNNPRADYTLQRYDLRLRRDISRDFYIQASASYEERDSDFSFETYDESRVGLSINYQFL